MNEAPAHDLHDFMQQISQEMASEYLRIQLRAKEDPGTAGDQGEENWAELIRGWIPSTYEVVTKGRIISQDGRTSPQVDVIVLKDVYPKKLRNKKHYLAAGVAAAFECKTTLRASHIAEATETCGKIKDLYPIRTGTPFRELHTPILYGLLAHSHSWKRDNSTPEENITNQLADSDSSYVSHPRQTLDVLCVADLGTWTSSMISFIGPRQIPYEANSETARRYGPDGSATSSHIGLASSRSENKADPFTPLGSLISYLTRRLAWENARLRDLADYYLKANLDGVGQGGMRTWSSAIYSDEIRSRVEAGQLSNGKPWDEWSVVFF